MEEKTTETTVARLLRETQMIAECLPASPFRETVKRIHDEVWTEYAVVAADNARLLQSALASQRDADKLLDKLHAAEREREEFKESYRLAMVSVNDAYDKGKETAEANIRAEIADGGTSCHWCLETTTRKERQRCLAIADKIGFDAVNRTDAQSCCGEIAAKIESGE